MIEASSSSFAKEQKKQSDPNIPQRAASDPSASVWVSASAGTGKTKVLTDRVLRLLLPASDRKATPPHRILCITFTKAAAAEMAIRINERLAAWAIMDDDVLVKEMEEKLLGVPPTQEQIEAARTLFTQVIDTPGGLKIMTIHAFCQSVLGRFPLEAGLSPNFRVIDEREATQFLTQARDKILRTAKETDNKVLTNIATEQNEDQLTELLKIVLKERLQLSCLSRRYPDRESLFEGICGAFSCPVYNDSKDFLREVCHTKSFNETGMRQICTAMAQGSKKDQERSVSLQSWLDIDILQRIDLFEEYCDLILTKKGNARKLTQKVVSFDVACEPVWQEEADRLGQARETLKKLHETQLTRDLVLLGTSILKEYQKKKATLNLLDYDDLILSTLDLLQKEGQNAWVLFKLDGGLDHILLDEAQDTNPEQWEIIDRLSSEFFTGQGQAEDVTRTVFVVGDEKQSIYSFQRADPDSFQRMRDYFRGLVKNAQKKWKDIDLFVSFRSCDAVLNLVDQVFVEEEERASLALPKDQLLSHESFRTGQAGLVELWPLYERQEEEKIEAAGWQLPVSPVNRITAVEHMAQDIALKIRGWIDSNEYLPSKNRPIHAGDIMILVRTRTKLVKPIVRALKNHNIPVSGVDRMVLKDRIEILDLLALGKFCCLTEDDLSLACFLKSPLINMSEETLYELCVDRTGSLWDALRECAALEVVSNYISLLLKRSKTLRPFEFYNTVLNMPCPADSKNSPADSENRSALRAFIKRLGDDVSDPLEAFLNEIITFEQDHIPTLEGFLHWMEHSDEDIKREIEEQSQQVRIMTIHGAKGLEAPIVFLPDTIMASGAMKGDRFLWPHKTKLDTPIWSPRSAEASSFYTEYLRKSQRDLKQEYRRQLYVTLTRAEDRLYICGCKGKKKPDEESWFFSMEKAMESIGEPVGEEEAAVYRYQRGDVPTLSVLTKNIENKSDNTVKALALPVWATTPCPAEPDPPRPLVPSRPSRLEPAAASPLDKEHNNRFKRGNITHKLLQILPDLPADQWEVAAKSFVSKDTYRLSQAQQDSIVVETLTILNDPDFSEIFGTGSMAEVPVTGLLEGNQLVSGQIDRLLVTEDRILIVDYKTNRPSPKIAEHIPEIYVQQMRLYKALMHEIYPGRKVSCALIWTDDARLMPVKV